MQRNTLVRLLLVLVIAFTTFSCSEETPQDKQAKLDRKQEVKDYVAHHLLDSHDFGLFTQMITVKCTMLAFLYLLSYGMMV